MRLYTQDLLEGKTKEQLNVMLDNVKTSIVFTDKEKVANIEILECKINGGVNSRNDAILRDIEAGMADIDDLGGN